MSETVKRKPGRPVGARDSYPRVVRRQPVDEEFMPTGTETPTPEPTVREALRAVTPEYVKNLQERVRTGKVLSPHETRLLVEAMQTDPPKRPSQWKTMVQAATPVEVQMIANIARRAMEQPEVPIWVGTEPWTNQEIIEGKAP